ncbi:MAG TPA: PqqD family protein [Thermodesulfatator atlanticus]|uniref:PqqD family protein n=1 Tax=Thermodesulfatator atlanticus TaxID=501497 RepID=A0A7V5U1R9_9BACT|nr:PqqD family protein [Thermodesulfatator atlanticus]
MKLKRLAISEEGFVFDPETGNSYTVNETGLLILKKLREGLSPEEIAGIMSEEYGISREEALRDIQDFLEAMARFGLWEEKYG